MLQLLSRTSCASIIPRPSLLTSTIFIRSRTTVITKGRQTLSGALPRSRGPRLQQASKHTPTQRPLLPVSYPQPTTESLVWAFSAIVQDWSTRSLTRTRLISFGIPKSDLKRALSAYTEVVQRGELFKLLKYDERHLERIAYDISHAENNSDALDAYLTSLFYEWGASSAGQLKLSQLVSAQTVAGVRELFLAADLSNPPALHPITRLSPPRKVIMHVGPTNSGKTHNALRALAASKRGIYAGPLRLLAHEIWERLNKGQIVPLGVDPDTDAEPDDTMNLDVAAVEDGKPIVRKQGDSRFVRPCNLITGEEQRIVDEDAGLTSATVEMISQYTRQLDVAVLDEIQMIAEPDRGGSWTQAVLGLNAKELHLCGEETAVPLIQSMLKDTGDELIIHRYQRLSPLQVGESSIRGDYKQIQKGDCVVTFSRSGIFSAKKEIEAKSGLKCAVAYGRLPPEIRSEQAALFNDPESGYDVMIGSDALGMGLNLKIKRIIFDTVYKWNGTQRVILSTSQIKQIAGRAGRYGLHGEDQTGGIATTLYEQDLPVLRQNLKLPAEPLKYARVNPTGDAYESIINVLPLGSPLSVALQVCKYVSKMHPSYQFQDIEKGTKAHELVAEFAPDMTLRDQMLLQLAPAPWRDPLALEAIAHLMSIYQKDMYVGAHALLEVADFKKTLNHVIALKAQGKTKSVSADILSTLESLHKTLVLYLWLSYRNPVSFTERALAEEFKARTEGAMDWCLRALSKGKPSDGTKTYTTKGKHEKRKENDYPRRKSGHRQNSPSSN